MISFQKKKTTFSQFLIYLHRLKIKKPYNFIFVCRSFEIKLAYLEIITNTRKYSIIYKISRKYKEEVKQLRILNIVKFKKSDTRTKILKKIKIVFKLVLS